MWYLKLAVAWIMFVGCHGNESDGVFGENYQVPDDQKVSIKMFFENNQTTERKLNFLLFV